MSSLTPLIRKNVPSLNNRPVKVLQFGEGNFLRAFADWVIDILNSETSFNGDIQIIQPLKNGMGNVINSQDGLYHVVLNGIKNGESFQETRLITSVKGVINPFEDIDAYYKQAENPELRFLISNTTEAGIVYNADDKDTHLPETFPGKVTSLLYHRFQFFQGASDKGLILMPFEMIVKIGVVLKECILRYCELWSLPI